MFNLFAMAIGSIFIGFGTGSALVGMGVAIVAFGFHLHINDSLSTMYAHVMVQMTTIYRKLP